MSCRKFNGNLGGLTTARGGRGKTARRDAVIQADHEQTAKGDRKEIPAYCTYTTIPWESRGSCFKGISGWVFLSGWISPYAVCNIEDVGMWTNCEWTWILNERDLPIGFGRNSGSFDLRGSWFPRSERMDCKPSRTAWLASPVVCRAQLCGVGWGDGLLAYQAGSKLIRLASFRPGI